MSHFVIIPKDSSFDKQALDETLLNMHLHRRKDIHTPAYTLIVHFKSNEQTDEDCLFVCGEDMVFMSGTFFYKDHNFKESLGEFYKDLVNDDIDTDLMRGQFVLVAIRNGALNIFNDALGCHRLFRNKTNGIISTSFLASWFSNATAATANVEAIREKVLSGYIVYPYTLVQEVSDITYEVINQQGLVKNYFPARAIGSARGKESKEFQVAGLKDYFSTLSAFAKNRTVSLGVSAGFDSRLLLSLIKDFKCRYLYSHLTKGVHNKEAAIAKELASKIGAELHINETEHPANLPVEQQVELLDELIYYYDGRTANNSGAFSVTGTYQYNFDHLKEVYIGLNGKGGEVYRNYYNHSGQVMGFNKWYEGLIFYPSAFMMLPGNERKQLLENIGKRIASRLKVEDDRWGRWQLHRYYSEVRQPDCESSITSAHNKITHYLAPFFDHALLRNAYRSFDAMGKSDLFQASMIAEIDPAVASVTSKYGYNFVEKSWKWRLKSFVARELPFQLKMKKKDKAFRKLLAGRKPSDPLITTSLEQLKLVDPGMNWEPAFFHYAQKNVCFNLARLLALARSNAKL